MNTKTREGASAGRNLRCLEIMFLAISKGKENFCQKQRRYSIKHVVMDQRKVESGIRS